MAAIAALASSSLGISTKPKPFELPVSLSIITLADVTSPCAEKSSCSSSPVVDELNFATNKFIKKLTIMNNKK
jgi:hypothetical protein